LILLDTVVSIVAVLVGAACIVFRAGFTRLVVSTQNAAWASDSGAEGKQGRGYSS